MSLLAPVETGIVRATVRIKLGAWTPLNPMVEPLLVRTVVDTSLLRPDMFELTFYDTDGTALDLAGITIGTEIEVSAGASTTALMSGEVTSIEGDYDHLVCHTVVRGYEQTHRLQRARRSRTFEGATDGDIATQVAKDAGLKVGTVEDPGVTHRFVAQVAQTDWEFLHGRAVEIGYETGVREGEFFFRPAPGMSPGGAGGMLGDAAAMVGLGDTPTLRFGQNLRWLRPRISSAGLTGETEVRVWDADGASVVSARAPLKSATAKVDQEPADLAKAHGTPGMPKIPTIPFLPSFLGASDDAFVVVDRPLGWGSDAQSAADAVAAGMAEHRASTFAEAEGSCMATPGVVAGAKVVLENVPAPFGGEWYVTTAQHVFDNAQGYDIRFEVSGRHDRSLRGLIAGGTSARDTRSLLGGLVPGIVSDNIDDQGRYRVRVALPWLASNFVTDWARVVMPGLGEAQGLVMMPEIGDEVLVGFEFGDVRRAYVLGGVATSKTASGLDLGGDVVTKGIPGGKVVRRGLVSREGHKVLIDDDAEPPNRNASGITIGNADDTVTVHLDDLNKELSIVCDASAPAAKIVIKQNGSGGGIVIEQSGKGGTIEIKSAGNVTVEAGAPDGSLTLKGGAGVKIDGGTGTVELSGSMVKLN